MKPGILLLLMGQALSLSAQNVTVTFQPAALPGGVTIVPQWVEQGMRLSTPSGLASNDASNNLYPDHGNAYAQTLSGWSPLTITSVSLQPFALIRVDLAEYSTLFAVPKSVTFLGTLVDSTTVSVTFTTDGMIDGNGPLPDFQTFFFPASFANLKQVVINTDTYAIDNLVVAVPEPGAFSLLVLGFGLAGVVKLASTPREAKEKLCPPGPLPRRMLLVRAAAFRNRAAGPRGETNLS